MVEEKVGGVFFFGCGSEVVEYINLGIDNIVYSSVDWILSEF